MSAYLFTKEAGNYARLSNVLLSVCTDLLRDVFTSNMDPQDFGNINKALQRKEHRLKKILNKDQIDILFPKNSRTVNLHDLDLSLMYSLIRNVSAVPKPSTGWGKDPVDNPRDKSLAANVERLRMLRNKLTGHSVDGMVSDTDFRMYWQGIEMSVGNIETALNARNHYLPAVQNLRTETLDIDKVQSLKTQMQALEERLKGISKDDRDKLMVHYAFLKENIEPRTLVHLFHKDGFLDEQQERELTRTKGRTERVALLIQLLLQMKPEAYPKFLHYLKDTDNEYIAERLEGKTSANPIPIQLREGEPVSLDIKRPSVQWCCTKWRLPKLSAKQLPAKQQHSPGASLKVSVQYTSASSTTTEELETDLLRELENAESSEAVTQLLKTFGITFKGASKGCIELHLHCDAKQLSDLTQKENMEEFLMKFFSQRGIRTLLPEGRLRIRVTIGPLRVGTSDMKGSLSPLSREIEEACIYFAEELEALVITDKLVQQKTLSEYDADIILHSQPQSRRARMKRLLFYLFVKVQMDLETFYKILEEIGYPDVEKQIQDLKDKGLLFDPRETLEANKQLLVTSLADPISWKSKFLSNNVATEEMFDNLNGIQESDSREITSDFLARLFAADTETIQGFLSTLRNSGVDLAIPKEDIDLKVSCDMSWSVFIGDHEVDPISVTPHGLEFVSDYELDIPDSPYKSEATDTFSTSDEQEDVSPRSEKEKMATNKILYAIQAAADDDVETLRSMRLEGVNLSDCDYDSRSPLHLACEEEHVDVVKYLLNDVSVDTNVKDRWRKTAFDIAREKDNKAIITVFRHKILEAVDAASSGDFEAIQRMHKAGYNLNYGDYDGRTPLHLAAAEGHINIVKYLVNEAKVDVNIKDRWGNTALDQATASKQDRIIPLLKDKTKKSLSILDAIAAASKGNVQLLKRYREDGTDLSKGDYDKRTPLHLACAEGQVEVVRYLVQDLQLNTGCKDRWGETPIDQAKSAKSVKDDNKKKIIEILEKKDTGAVAMPFKSDRRT